jgi:hypothetical protein
VDPYEAMRRRSSIAIQAIRDSRLSAENLTMNTELNTKVMGNTIAGYLDMYDNPVTSSRYQPKHSAEQTKVMEAVDDVVIQPPEVQEELDSVN